ncbi:membrane progestin receptor gamma isoform X1 [Cygnus atratus]|uniref:membrane progestin receptor gamma isoform X1 n=1 Tax=Cygnus atratus TaxID=8868 RepID=UPI0021B743BB|nr:membrane progestin receptor gamma isoform X1 [Cygnus atratus]XP_050568956.1 membrane progestin receptor gamma isoform X1 [Cygnus atratus]
MLSLKLPRLLSINQVPKGYQEQGILCGYRPPRSSAADCLLSVFQMTNETLNIWTHFVPAWYVPPGEVGRGCAGRDAHHLRPQVLRVDPGGAAAGAGGPGGPPRLAPPRLPADLLHLPPGLQLRPHLQPHVHPRQAHLLLLRLRGAQHVQLGFCAGVFSVRFPRRVGQQHLPPLLRPHRRVQHRGEHQPVLLFQVPGGGAAAAQQGVPHPGLRVPLPLRQHSPLLQVLPVRRAELRRARGRAALQAHRLRLPHLLHLRHSPAGEARARTLRLHRAQPPGFPRVRDPGHALPDGSHHDGHERAPRAAAGHLAAALRPADPGAHGHLHGHRPGRHRAQLRVPLLHARAWAQRQATRALGFGSRWHPCCSASQSLNSTWMG